MDSQKKSIARELLKNKNYGQALLVANEILASSPGSLDALWISSTAYFELGDDACAETQLRSYLHRDPGNIEAIVRLVTSLKRQDKVEEALDYLNEAVTECQHPDLFSEIASLILDKGDSDKAILYANQALQLDPKSFLAHMVMASALIFLGAPKEAMKYLDIAQEISPANPQVYINIAAVHELMGDYIAQAESLEMALRCDNSLQGLNLVLAELFLRHSQIDNSVLAYQKYLVSDPTSVQGNFGIANAYYVGKEYELAKRHYLNVVKESPDHLDAWCQLGQIFLLTDNLEWAAKCRDQVLRLDSGNEWAISFKA